MLIPDAWIFLIALLGPAVFWLIFGIASRFPDERDRRDWLWGGLLAGLMMAILYMGLR